MKKKLIFLLSFSYSFAYSQPQCPVKKPEETPVWITVFVHGAIKAEWIFNSLLKVMTDSVEGSTYEKAVTSIRNDSYFFYNNAMQEVGLKKIELRTGNSHSGARGIAYLYDQISSLAQNTPTIQYYYTFGWSGLMSRNVRLSESENLYRVLAKEVQTISKKHHVTPRIRLIGYSHGGNVCLNLAEIKNNVQDLCLRVDELILVGSPVQAETDRLVADPMFEKIYNFYSPDDLIQPSDMFSSKRSGRVFKSHASFPLPDKLKQICIRVARYTPRQKKRDLPSPVPLDYKKNIIRKRLMNPGHIELWYLGWAAPMYRNNFPLYPFPVVNFVSFITAQIDRHPDLGNKIGVTLHPQQEIMTLKSKHGQTKKTVAFIPLTKLGALQKNSERFKPDEDFYQEYSNRSREALKFARKSKNGGVVRVLKPSGSSYKISRTAMCLQ